MLENKLASISLTQLKKLHNKAYPNVITHEPTAHGIGIRFKSTFDCDLDKSKNEYFIKLKEV